MVAGGTSSNNRGRGTARKLLAGRTLPKDSAAAPYKVDKNSTGRPRSKGRAQSLEFPTKQKDPHYEDLEMEGTQQNSEEETREINSDSLQTSKEQTPTLNTNKGKEKERDSDEGTLQDNYQNEEEENIEKEEKTRRAQNPLGREILRRTRFRSEIKTPTDYEETKELLETVKSSLCAFPSFLGAHIVRRQGEDLKIIAEFGEEMQMQGSLQIRFDNEIQPTFQQVNKTNQETGEQRSIIVRDIPLNTQIGTVRGVLSRYGTIENIKIRLVGMWQTATVTYQEQEDAQNLAREWAIPFEKEYVRILPLENHRSHNEERSRYVLKLAGLPRGTTAFDLDQIREETNAKTTYIPRREWDYERERYAFMSFENNEDYKEAMDKTYTIDRQTSRFVTEHAPSCFRCGDSTHLSYECAERRVNREKQAAIERFAAVQNKFSNRHGKGSSYAEALKRNRSQSRIPQQRVVDKPVARTTDETPIEDRILNLEIKMTSMHNLLMKIADKVQYWEELEEAEDTEGQELMDTEDKEDKAESHSINVSQERQSKQTHQTDPKGPKGKKGEDENIRARQERLENNVDEMMEILEKIAGKFDSYGNTAQKPGQERGSTKQNQ